MNALIKSIYYSALVSQTKIAALREPLRINLFLNNSSIESYRLSLETGEITAVSYLNYWLAA